MFSEPRTLREGEAAAAARGGEDAAAEAGRVLAGGEGEARGIALVFLVIAVGLFFRTRGERGFGQQRQAALLCLIAGAVFGAIGLGLVNF